MTKKHTVKVPWVQIGSQTHPGCKTVAGIILYAPPGPTEESVPYKAQGLFGTECTPEIKLEK